MPMTSTASSAVPACWLQGRSSLQLKQSSQPLLQKAAHLLGRTEGSFQRVCRGLGILRWPYRVRKSLQAIMSKTEQYLVSLFFHPKQPKSKCTHLCGMPTSGCLCVRLLVAVNRG